jgi:hypothetical protein
MFELNEHQIGYVSGGFPGPAPAPAPTTHTASATFSPTTSTSGGTTTLSCPAGSTLVVAVVKNVAVVTCAVVSDSP